MDQPLAGRAIPISQPPQPARGDHERNNPHQDDQKGPYATSWPFFASRGLGAELVHQAVGNHSNGKQDADGDDDHVVQVAEDRHKVGDEINRAERVGGHAGCKNFRVPRNTGISSGDPHGDDVAFDRPRPFLRSLEHTKLYPSANLFARRDDS